MQHAVAVGFHLAGLARNADRGRICIYGAAAIIQPESYLVQLVAVIIGDIDFELNVCAVVYGAAAVLADTNAGACRSVNGEVVGVVAALGADGDIALEVGQINSAAVAVAGYAIGVRTDKDGIGVRRGVCRLAVCRKCQSIDRIAAFCGERHIIVAAFLHDVTRNIAAQAATGADSDKHFIIVRLAFCGFQFNRGRRGNAAGIDRQYACCIHAEPEPVRGHITAFGELYRRLAAANRQVRAHDAVQTVRRCRHAVRIALIERSRGSGYGRAGLRGSCDCKRGAYRFGRQRNIVRCCRNIDGRADHAFAACIRLGLIMDRISNTVELQIAVKMYDIGAVSILTVRDDKRRQIVAVQRREIKALAAVRHRDDMPPHRGHRVTGAVLCGDDTIRFRRVRRKSGRTQGERCGKRRTDQSSDFHILSPLFSLPAGSRQGRLFISRCAVDGGSPCVIGHDPLLAVIQTANICLINKRTAGSRLANRTVNIGVIHHTEAGRHRTKNKHNLRYRFTGFQTECGRRCLQYAVDRRVKVICQRARCLIEVGLINHLIGDTGVISAGYDLIQLYRLIRQIVAPVEAVQTDCGVIRYARDRPLNWHTRRYLLRTGLADYNIGVNALVQNLQTDDLACKLDFRFKGFTGYTVIVRCLGFFDGVTTQRQ